MGRKVVETLSSTAPLVYQETANLLKRNFIFWFRYKNMHSMRFQD